MDANREQSSFWQFSDQLRLHTSNLSNLSIGDSIWSDPNGSDHNMGGSWKSGFGTQKLAFGSSNFNRQNNNVDSISINSSDNSEKNGNYFNSKSNSGPMNSYFSRTISKPAFGNGKKNGNGNYNNSVDGNGNGKKKNDNSSNGNNNGNGVDKRFKTLPPSEALPRSEAVGGYIFVCNNDTMQENLKRQLFGLPPRYRDSVRAITPGLPLFLYNYSTHQLHGIFEAASFGGTNIDPAAWEDKKSHGESRFPAQVRVMTRKICEPLEEDSFRPILHHYDGPKFRLELSVPEALALLDIFAENNA